MTSDHLPQQACHLLEVGLGKIVASLHVHETEGVTCMCSPRRHITTPRIDAATVIEPAQNSIGSSRSAPYRVITGCTAAIIVVAIALVIPTRNSRPFFAPCRRSAAPTATLSLFDTSFLFSMQRPFSYEIEVRINARQSLRKDPTPTLAIAGLSRLPEHASASR